MNERVDEKIGAAPPDDQSLHRYGIVTGTGTLQLHRADFSGEDLPNGFPGTIIVAMTPHDGSTAKQLFVNNQSIINTKNELSVLHSVVNSRDHEIQILKKLLHRKEADFNLYVEQNSVCSLVSRAKKHFKKILNRK